METIHITMPDGAIRDVPLGTTAAEIAHQISPRLAKEALVARIGPLNAPAGAPLGPTANGESFLVDLRAPIDQDVRLSILTPKDPEAIQVLRHSAAHLLAAAVLELFPNVKLGIGPPIDSGFFYDFVRDEPFTPEDLERIEKKMRELAAQDIPNERKMMPKPEALELCRRLLERPGRQPADAAHLRRVLLHAAGAGRLFAQARRGQAARSPAARAGTRLVFDSGRGRAGTDFLAPQRRPGPQADGRLAARRIAAPRLRSGLHAPHHAPGFVEDQRP